MVNRLKTLYELQLIDNQLDELEELRGDLPLAVNELNGKIQTIKDQIEDKENEKKESTEKMITNEDEVERLSENLTKYKAQLYQVRNNKEYDALTKEIDNSEETIDKLKSENKALDTLVLKLDVEVNEIAPQLDDLHEEMNRKQDELKKIIAGNEKEELKLQERREKVVANIRKNDYNTYMRIRKACGGKAVVPINRSACSGCHNVVPPQRQLEVKANKRLFTCESCGRILVSPFVADEAES